MKRPPFCVLLVLCSAASSSLRDAWLQYAPVAPGSLGMDVRAIQCSNRSDTATSPLANACVELSAALSSMLRHPVPLVHAPVDADGTLMVRTDGTYADEGDAETSTFHVGSVPADERFVLAATPCSAAAAGSSCLMLSGPTGRAVLFGAFRFLAALQRTSSATASLPLPLRSAPDTPLRAWNSKCQQMCMQVLHVGNFSTSPLLFSSLCV